MIGTTKYGSFVLILSVTFQFICLPIFCEIKKIPQEQYWTGQSNIVAAVSAYERIMHLSSGQRIPVYHNEIDDLCTNYFAIIFYVITPEKYKGNYFRLKSMPTEKGSGFIPPAYQIGKLYYFPFIDSPDPDLGKTGYWLGINPRDLFSMPEGKPGRLYVGKTNGEIYYASRQEAIDALVLLEIEHDQVKTKMQLLAKEIDKIKVIDKNIDVNKNPEYKRLKSSYFDLKIDRLPSNEYKQKEVKMQIEMLNHIEINNEGSKNHP